MPTEEEKNIEEQLNKVTAITVVGKNGETRELLKGSDGKFVRAPRAMVPTRTVTTMLRKWLMEPYTGKDGKLDKNSKIRLRKMWNTMTDIASGESDLDPKSQMAAVQAFEAIMLRTHGKPALNDEEQDALKRAGIRIVVIPAPMGLAEMEEKPREVLKPSFIEGVMIQRNDPPIPTKE